MRESAPPKGRIFFLVLLAGTLLTGQVVAQGIKPLPNTCCIGGEYRGVAKDAPSSTCPEPAKFKFVMVIDQAPRCGSAVTGKVTNLSDGGVNNFTGNVVPGAKRCCDLEISWSKPHEVTKIRGTLCKQGEKLQGKGTFTSQYDQTSCTGEWTMEK